MPDELVDWLGRSNSCPPGTLLSTGTGILVPDEHALADGDVVEITLERVGTLRNPVRRLEANASAARSPQRRGPSAALAAAASARRAPAFARPRRPPRRHHSGSRRIRRWPRPSVMSIPPRATRGDHLPVARDLGIPADRGPPATAPERGARAIKSNAAKADRRGLDPLRIARAPGGEAQRRREPRGGPSRSAAGRRTRRR